MIIFAQKYCDIHTFLVSFILPITYKGYSLNDMDKENIKSHCKYKASIFIDDTKLISC